MKVRDIMTAEVETCGPEATIEEVASMMGDQDVGSIPVVEKGNLRGMITDRDLVIRGDCFTIPIGCTGEPDTVLRFGRHRHTGHGSGKCSRSYCEQSGTPPADCGR